MKGTLKAAKISTGYSVYPSGFAYELNDPEALIIEYNGADRGRGSGWQPLCRA